MQMGTPFVKLTSVMRGHAGSRRVTVVGAGLSGSLIAICLARRGWSVDVFERRPDPRIGLAGEGRSINLGLSARGIAALDHVGLLDAVLARATPMRGRVVHQADGGLDVQPYGTSAEQILRSVLRHDLNVLLIDAAEAAGAGFHFGAKLTGLAKGGPDQEPSCQFATADGERTVSADTVVGADGAFSAVRAQLHRGEPADYSQEFLPWGYKELYIPPGDGGLRTDHEALHVWPGHDGLVVAHPNIDASLTGTIFLPLTGPDSFATLDSVSSVKALLDRRFPDLLDIAPNAVDQILAQPVGHLVTVRTSPWHHGDRVVLIGDACHAVYPFYGQGMNSSFEDCLVLDGCLDRNGTDVAAAFAEYQTLRKVNTDVLAELSKSNFTELSSRLASPLFLARKRADLALHRALGDTWTPLYTMVSHTTMPYADALRRADRQQRALGVAAGAATAAVVAAGLTIATKLRNTTRRRRSC